MQTGCVAIDSNKDSLLNIAGQWQCIFIRMGKDANHGIETVWFAVKRKVIINCAENALNGWHLDILCKEVHWGHEMVIISQSAMHMHCLN
eukprot:scaffold5517_cov77-Skeletonema_dohrnii-CCMP3373.AAC.3